MGIQVSNLNNKFRLPLTWRLDGRAPQFHLYKEDSPNPDSGSIRTDLPLLSRCSEGPDSDVITNATTRGKRKLRRARKKFRKRSSRCDLSSSSDSDERSFGLNEDDIDRYLAQSSLEYPGNIPVVICSTCILYQTTLSGCQEEIPLQLGLIVNAIFKNHNWIYIQTPHCEEGYVFYKHCIPLCVLPTKRKHLASRTADILGNLQELHRSRRGCLDNLEGLHRTDPILANRTAMADSILGNTEQLHRSSGCLDNLEELNRSRGCSDEHILDWNGNHVLGEDVFDNLNGYENGKHSQRATDGDFTGNPTEGPYSIESFNRNPTEGPYSSESVTAGNINEGIDVQDNGAVEHSSKGMVGNKRISRDSYDPWRNCGLETADLKEAFEQPRFGDAERPRSDSSFTDGGYFFDDIVNTELLDANQRGDPGTYCLSFGVGRNVVDLCDNRQFGELEGYMRFEDPHVVDLMCECGHFTLDPSWDRYGSQYSGLGNGWNGNYYQRQTSKYPSIGNDCGTEENRDSIFGTDQKILRVHGENCTRCKQKDQVPESDSILTIFKEVNEPRHHSTPIKKVHSKTAESNESRKMKKHCSSSYAHRYVEANRKIATIPSQYGQAFTDIPRSGELPKNMQRDPHAEESNEVDQYVELNKNELSVVSDTNIDKKSQLQLRITDDKSQTNDTDKTDLTRQICKTTNTSDRQKCSSSELCVSLQSTRMDSYQNLKSLRNEPSLLNVDFSFQYNWEPIREPFLNINNVHHREFNKQSKQKQGFEDKKFKTIEIMKDPSATLGRKTNRVKKPCFKIHNKLETKTNPKEGVDKLEHIAENEPTERVTPKDSESPSGKRDKINSNINNSSHPKDETPKPQTKTASPTCEHQQLDNVTKRTANNRQDNVIQTSANIFRSKSEVSRKVDTLSTASYPLRKKVSKTKHATSTDNISLCSEKTIDDLFLKYKRFRGKSRRSRDVGKQKPRDTKQNLIMIIDDYYNDDDNFHVVKNEIVVLLNVYKSWLYVQTYKQQNGFIPSYIAAYAVV